MAFVDGEPPAFRADTRGRSLEEWGMARATSSGLDIPRSEFIAALEATGRKLPAGAWIVFTR